MIWLLLTLLCILIQGCYSMIEMASLTFNRIRLQYYVSLGIKQAIWLQYVLEKPYRLFGSAMLGVNIALQIGSQAAREFYSAIHLDPDLAPITQVFLVVIFAELSPLFAARRYSEHVIMLGAPIIYFTYRVFFPFIWLLNLFIKGICRLIGKQRDPIKLDLSREDLQKILETEGDEFNFIVSNLFSLRQLKVGDVMTKLDELELLAATSKVGDLRKKMQSHFRPYYPLYHKSAANISGIVHPAQLTSAPDEALLKDRADAPWFIPQKCPLREVFEQFKFHRDKVAVVLGAKGVAVGTLTLDTLLKRLFQGRFDNAI